MPGRGPVVLLSVLAALFFLRVLGQMLVAFVDVTVLPAMPAWYSGLLPYPLLLPVQLVILAVQVKISFDLARGHGFFVVRRPGWGRGLQVFAVIYFLGMAVRYALTMAWHPERRWLGTGTIPVVFHWVLATYLFTLGRFLARAPGRSPA
jgi:hypothetical protein